MWEWIKTKVESIGQKWKPDRSRVWESLSIDWWIGNLQAGYWGWDLKSIDSIRGPVFDKYIGFHWNGN